MLTEYSDAIHSMSEIEKILLKNSIKILNKTLEPGVDSLNLSSLGISDFIKNCKLEISNFKDIKKKIDKSAGHIDEFVKGIEDAQILREFDFEHKKDSLYNPMEFLSHFDEHMKRIIQEKADNYHMVGD